uniref:Cation channel sperm-associated protein 1 n=1 Tax=Prolemur simus TaxID=1328070 RepID=A0A8C9AMK3_PROSS
MDQTSMSEKAQNEADTNNLDMFSQPHSSSSHHRPGHSGAYRRHESPDYNVAHHHSESHHHGTPQHHDGSHHSREFQDLQDNPSSYHSSQSHHHGEALHHGRAHSPTALGPAASHGIVSSHDAFGEDYFNDGHHHSSRMHHSGAHHVGSHHGESSLHVGSQHTEYSHHVGSHHSGSHHHGRHHHYGRSHHRGRPHYHGGPKPLDENLYQYSYGGSSHHDGSYHHSKTSHHTGLHRGERSRHKVYHHEDHHLNREHHHGLHRYDDSHSNRQYREYPQVTSQLSIPGKTHSLVLNSLSSAISLKTPHPPGEAQARGMASSITQALSRIYSLGSQLSTGGRSQRAHRRMHAWNRWLWEKLSYCIEEFRKMIWNLTHSLVFEVFIFFVICLNTVMLVVQTFAEVEIRGEWYFTALDSVFFCIYVLEALLKIIALGFLYFRDMWNNLDFFIMIIAMLDFMLMQLDSFSIYQLSLFRVLKVFKSLRALRAIRVLRKLSVLTSLHEVTETLARSLPSITAILILMFTCLFLFSVVLRALFRKSDPKRFQSIFTTIFTLFTMLTLDDWSLIYMDSRAQGAWYIVPILMIYIIIQYFIFLNLVIAVLVDNFQMALLKGLGKVKQERATQVQEKLLEDSLMELKQAGTHLKQLLEKKFGAMTEKQQELLFHYLQLVAGVENQQQKFRSQAFIIDEIVDVTFEDRDYGRQVR